VAAIPHKSRTYRSILDLSFSLRLEDGGIIESVNNTMEKWAPRGAIDQLGHLLKRLIHAFAEADNDAVILMAKWDIQDGFLAAQLPPRGRVEFLLRMAARTGQTAPPRSPKLIANGMGGISTIFLRGIINSARCHGGVHQNENRILPGIRI
jgi:hypothetical protein